MSQPPSIGRIVHYTLSAHDAKGINKRRADFAAFQREIAQYAPHEPGSRGASGHIAHYGNGVQEGDVFPAVVVVDHEEAAGTANLQVHLDGNDIYWATSRARGDLPGNWHWPVRETASGPMNFGDALAALRDGKQITRLGWNAPGQFVAYQKGYPDGIAINANTAEATGLALGTVCRFRPYLMLHTADASFVPWAPTVSDVLAEDSALVT